ncbi:DsbA family protein [Sphingomonas humi]|uniref:DsbA family protein n=1 Tax=Sphingomonas humi TaxID=335630 RepID=A0ABP7REZ6_9SPHN
MKKLTLAVVASLAVLGTTACKQQPAAQNDNPAAAPVQAPNGDWSKLVSQTTEGGMLMGNPQAKVKVVEFGSLTCPHCAEFAEKDQPKLINNYVKTGNVSFEFRNFVRDPLDITMSLITRCAGATPQFFTLTDGMYADQKSFFDRIQAVPEAQLTALQSMTPAQQFAKMAEYAGVQEWAAQRGLPSAKTSQCLANQAEIDRIVQMNSDASSSYDIPGTPTFLVNGEVVKGQAGQDTWQGVEAAIKAAQ